MTTMSPGERAGTRHFSTHSSSRAFIGRSQALGAASPRGRGTGDEGDRLVILAGRRPAVAVHVDSVHALGRDWWKRRSRRRRRVSLDQDRVGRRTLSGAAPERPGAAARERAREQSLDKRSKLCTSYVLQAPRRTSLSPTLEPAPALRGDRVLEAHRLAYRMKDSCIVFIIYRGPSPRGFTAKF